MTRRSRGALLALGAATALAAFALGRFTAPGHAPPAQGDLAGSIRAALGAGDTLERLGRTTGLLERLGPEELPAVVAVYERMLPWLDPWELGPFFAAWARFDPKGALDHALAWPLRDRREQRRRGVRAALERWAQADPSAARGAAEEIAAAHPRLRGQVWSSLATGWVRSERGPEGLAAFLAELRPLHYRDEAAAVALRELVRAGGADPALAWADTILRDDAGDETFKRRVFEAAAGEAAGWDPPRTAAWAMEHLEAAYASEGPFLVAERWSREDGAAAMAWLAEQGAGAQRDRAVREAFVEWSRADRPGAKAWLESLSPTEFHDPVLEVWAEQLVGREPLEALGWCQRILDSARQRRCLESGAGSWYARDAVAAEAWLQQSPLDEEGRSKVRNPARQRPAGPRHPRAAAGLR